MDVLSSVKAGATTTTKVSPSPLLDREIEETTSGLPDSFSKQLHSINEGNAVTIVSYIAAMRSEVNLSDHYRKDLIGLLSRFSKFNDNKPFKDLTRDDVIAFLETFRRTETQAINNLVVNDTGQRKGLRALKSKEK